MFFSTPVPVPSLAELARAGRAQAGLLDEPDAEDVDPLAAFKRLLSRLGQGLCPVLILDEAQACQDRLIEDLLALAAPTPEGASLLPIFVAGQPSIALRLAHAPAGSIGRRYELGPLDPADVAAFIHHRLKQAGCTESMPFAPEAIEQIAGYAHGVPGSINNLCRLAFFFAADKEENLIKPNSDLDLAASAALLSAKPLILSQLGSAPSSKTEALLQAVELERSEGERSVAESGISFEVEDRASQSAGSGAAAAIAIAANRVSAPEPGTTDWTSVRAEERIRRSSHPGRGAFAWAAAIVALVLGSAALVPFVYDSRWDFAATPAPRLAKVGDLEIPQPEAPEGDYESTTSSAENPSAPDGSRPATADATEENAGASVVAALENAAPAVGHLTSPSFVTAASLDAADTPRPPNESLHATATVTESESESEAKMPTRAKATSDVREALSSQQNAALESRDREAQSSSEARAREPMKPASAPALPARPVLDHAEIDRLLALGRQYVNSDRLVAPRFDNALAVYCRILRADPGSSEALAGIAAVKARVMEHARAQEASGDLEGAQRQLDKLKLIDAEYQAATGQPPASPGFGHDLGMPIPEPDPSGARDRQ